MELVEFLSLRHLQLSHGGPGEVLLPMVSFRTVVLNLPNAATPHVVVTPKSVE